MTSSPVATLNSHGSHGNGFAGPGSPTTKDNGVKILRVGDIYSCPIHGPNPITTGSAVWTDNGHAIARLGDSTACGATITTPGSPEWSST